MNRHRKIIARGIVFLLLGAIINVAVAWGFCLSAGLTSQSSSIGTADLAWLGQFGFHPTVDIPSVITMQEVRRCSGTGVQFVSYLERETPNEARLWESPGPPSMMYTWCFAQRVIAGWPAMTMTGSYCDPTACMPRHRVPQSCVITRLMDEFPILPHARSGNATFVPGRKWQNWEIGARLIPLATLWPGFAINTVFYAAALWVLFAAPGWVRRRLVIRGRARRGLCPACAYPIGTNPVCTECGTPVGLNLSPDSFLGGSDNEQVSRLRSVRNAGVVATASSEPNAGK